MPCIYNQINYESRSCWWSVHLCQIEENIWSEFGSPHHLRWWEFRGILITLCQDSTVSIWLSEKNGADLISSGPRGRSRYRKSLRLRTLLSHKRFCTTDMSRMQRLCCAVLCRWDEGSRNLGHALLDVSLTLPRLLHGFSAHARSGARWSNIRRNANGGRQGNARFGRTFNELKRYRENPGHVACLLWLQIFEKPFIKTDFFQNTDSNPPFLRIRHDTNLQYQYIRTSSRAAFAYHISPLPLPNRPCTSEPHSPPLTCGCRGRG